ncbi:hypothetical protein VP01_663g2 [Puccinia sorghi]|uniref:Uncharacterized protein n=1 Tax=Puccinia sorghi TaxID=27349 RepID=A0A0L6UH58_9BASI|nr:hypothetical protein VP01_663g2 [Puccinia sorghi]
MVFEKALQKPSLVPSDILRLIFQEGPEFSSLLQQFNRIYHCKNTSDIQKFPGSFLQTTQRLCQDIYIGKKMEFEWQFSWSMLHFTCRKLRNLTNFFVAKLQRVANATGFVETNCCYATFFEAKRKSGSPLTSGPSDEGNMHCKKNLINCMQLTCSMLQPSFHSNSTCLPISFLGLSACQLQAVEQGLNQGPSENFDEGFQCRNKLFSNCCNKLVQAFRYEKQTTIKLNKNNTIDVCEEGEDERRVIGLYRQECELRSFSLNEGFMAIRSCSCTSCHKVIKYVKYTKIDCMELNIDGTGHVIEYGGWLLYVIFVGYVVWVAVVLYLLVSNFLFFILGYFSFVLDIYYRFQKYFSCFFLLKVSVCIHKYACIQPLMLLISIFICCISGEAHGGGSSLNPEHVIWEIQWVDNRVVELKAWQICVGSIQGAWNNWNIPLHSLSDIIVEKMHGYNNPSLTCLISRNSSQLSIKDALILAVFCHSLIHSSSHQLYYLRNLLKEFIIESYKLYTTSDQCVTSMGVFYLIFWNHRGFLNSSFLKFSKKGAFNLIVASISPIILGAFWPVKYIFLISIILEHVACNCAVILFGGIKSYMIKKSDIPNVKIVFKINLNCLNCVCFGIFLSLTIRGEREGILEGVSYLKQREVLHCQSEADCGIRSIGNIKNSIYVFNNYFNHLDMSHRLISHYQRNDLRKTTPRLYKHQSHDVEEVKFGIYMSNSLLLLWICPAENPKNGKKQQQQKQKHVINAPTPYKIGRIVEIFKNLLLAIKHMSKNWCLVMILRGIYFYIFIWFCYVLWKSLEKDKGKETRKNVRRGGMFFLFCLRFTQTAQVCSVMVF